jgi:hypothetical protein
MTYSFYYYCVNFHAFYRMKLVIHVIFAIAGGSLLPIKLAKLNAAFVNTYLYVKQDT